MGKGGGYFALVLRMLNTIPPLCPVPGKEHETGNNDINTIE